jgi:hypothetical protein
MVTWCNGVLRSICQRLTRLALLMQIPRKVRNRKPDPGVFQGRVTCEGFHLSPKTKLLLDGVSSFSF